MSWIEMNPTDIGNSIFTEKEPLSATKHHLKIASIETAYRLNDLELLQTLAKSRQGLINNQLRRKIWPILLGLNGRKFAEEKEETESKGYSKRNGSNGKNATINGNEDDNLEELNTNEMEIFDTANESDLSSDFVHDASPFIPTSPSCKDKDQVILDVERSFVFYPKNPPKELQLKLLDTICTVLGRNPDLSYFQGYHDVAQVVLLVHEPNDIDSQSSTHSPLSDTSQILEAISLQMLRDFMTPGLSPALVHLDFVPLILTLEDAYLGEILRDNPPYYALSAVLTLFSHHVRSFDEICVVFDYIIASRNMAMPIYMYVALIISQKHALKGSANDPDCIHSILSNIADDFHGDLFEQVLKPASKLAEKYPLTDFKELYNKLSQYSVIKTLPQESDPTEIIYSIDRSQSVLHSQVIECQEQMKEEKLKQERASKEKRRAATEKALAKKIPTSTPPLTASALLLGKMMVIPIGQRKLIIPRSLLGLSICIGVLGVIASSYKYDIQFSWYRFFTKS